MQSKNKTTTMALFQEYIKRNCNNKKQYHVLEYAKLVFSRSGSPVFKMNFGYCVVLGIFFSYYPVLLKTLGNFSAFSVFWGTFGCAVLQVPTGY